MNLNQRLISGLLLLVALVTTVALLTVSALRGGAAHNGTAHTATLVAWIAIPAAILIAVGAAMAVLGPLRRSAQQVRAIGQGNLEQRLEWSAEWLCRSCQVLQRCEAFDRSPLGPVLSRCQ